MQPGQALACLWQEDAAHHLGGAHAACMGECAPLCAAIPDVQLCGVWRHAAWAPPPLSTAQWFRSAVCLAYHPRNCMQRGLASGSIICNPGYCMTEHAQMHSGRQGTTAAATARPRLCRRGAGARPRPPGPGAARPHKRAVPSPQGVCKPGARAGGRAAGAAAPAAVPPRARAPHAPAAGPSRPEPSGAWPREGAGRREGAARERGCASAAGGSRRAAAHRAASRGAGPLARSFLSALHLLQARGMGRELARHAARDVENHTTCEWMATFFTPPMRPGCQGPAAWTGAAGRHGASHGCGGGGAALGQRG
jgi:hypothetical protein